MSRSLDMEFIGSQGTKISAKLDLPDNDEDIIAYGVYAHCFTCGKDLAVTKNICQRLAQYGYAILRFDFTGVNKSEGDFLNTTFSSNVKDVLKACDFLKQNYEVPQIIMGHSLGGAAALYAAVEYEATKVVITLNAPYQPAHVTHHFQDKIQEIQDKGQCDVELLGGKTITIGKSFISDLVTKDTKAVLERLYKPLLVCHSSIDKTVNIGNAMDIFTNASHPKSFLALPESDHLLMKRSDTDYVCSVIKEWIKIYLPKKDKINKKDDKS